MADLVVASAPQRFSFGGRELLGRLERFTGSAKRRSVDHEFPGRDAAEVEDLGRKQMRLQVQLVFTGASCAKDYDDFKSFVLDNPFGLLVHPTAGNWQAYTDGPDEDVDFSRALDEILVRCEFKESKLDSTTTADVPDPATAAQNATDTKSRTQVAVAQYLGGLAKLQALTDRAQNAIDSALANISLATAPVDVVLNAITAVEAVGSSAIGKILDVQAKTQVLSQAVDDFVAAASDLFSGSDVLGDPTQVDNLIGDVEKASDDLQDSMRAAAVTAAGDAEASGMVDETLAACYGVAAALQASRPAMTTFTVPDLMDVIRVAQLTGDADTVLARASVILASNKIPNPAAIARGTRLLVPAR